MEKGKVYTLEDRIPKLKAQRKQKTNRRLIIYISFFFILLLGIIYFQSPLNYINGITVSGNKFVSEQTVMDKLSLPNKSRFWTTDLDKLTSRVELLPVVETVKITRKLPNNLNVVINEYDRVGYVERNSGYYPILDNGKILDTLEENVVSINAPVLINWSEEKSLQLMADELQKLPTEIINGISEILFKPTTTDPYSIVLYMNDGNEVRATVIKFAERMASYPAIARELADGEPMIIHMTVSPWAKSFDSKEEVQEEEAVDYEESEQNEN
jgi:cell division protein FtsQ